MNDNYIKFNNLGILVESSLNEVSQGNHNVDIYHIAYDIYDYTNSYVTLAVTLPNGVNLPELATSFKEFEFRGSIYKGFMFKLPQELTAIEGNLTITINLYSNENDNRLCSSRLNVLVHKTDYAENPTITDIQYHELLEAVREDFNEIDRKIESGELKGEKGDSATIIVESTYTLDPGTQASVINVGDENNAKLQFFIPRGDKGDKGEKGDSGSVKFIIVQNLPTENIDESALYLVQSNEIEGENYYTEYVYANNKWELIGGKTVEINLDNYVKNTDYAKGNDAGVVKISNSLGMGITGTGIIYPISASNSQIDEKEKNYNHISPSNLDYAVKVGMTTNKEEWTNEDKQKARELLNSANNEMATTIYTGKGYEGTPGLFMYDGGGAGGFFKSTAGGNVVGAFRIKKALYSHIDNRTPSNYHDAGVGNENHCCPIVPANLDYAVVSALTTNTITLTEEQKAKIKAWLGL